MSDAAPESESVPVAAPESAPESESVHEPDTVKPDVIRRLRALRTVADKNQAYEAAAWLLASYIADNEIGDALLAIAPVPKPEPCTRLLITVPVLGGEGPGVLRRDLMDYLETQWFDYGTVTVEVLP